MDSCIACGMSEINCPEVFKLNTIGDKWMATVKEDIDFFDYKWDT